MKRPFLVYGFELEMVREKMRRDDSMGSTRQYSALVGRLSGLTPTASAALAGKR